MRIPDIHPFSVALIPHRLMENMEFISEDSGQKLEDILDGVPNTHTHKDILTPSTI